jgi:hypothetical protein
MIMVKEMFKDFPIWKTITIGNLTEEELISKVLCERRVDRSTQFILDQGVEIAPRPCEYDIVLATADELEVPRGEGKLRQTVTFSAVKETILGFGFERLTPEMLLLLRLAHPYLDDPSWFLNAFMEPLKDEEGLPVLLRMYDFPYEGPRRPLNKDSVGSWVGTEILMTLEQLGIFMSNPVSLVTEGKHVPLVMPSEPWFSNESYWLFVKPRPG